MRAILIALSLLFSSLGVAHAQDALVVAVCGVLPQAYPVGSTQPLTVDVNGNFCIDGSGAGTVTSVGLSLPASVFAVTGSPVTVSGTLSATLQNQTANTVFAGPTTGIANTPSFRALVAADIPSLSATYVAIASLGTNVNTALGLTLNGSGAISATTSPTFVTPTLGAASATSVVIGGGSAITSSGVGGSLGTNAFNSTAYAPLASPTFTGTVTMPDASTITSGGHTGSALFTVTGTTAPTMAAGTNVFGGIISGPTMSANGEGAVYLASANGLTLMGKGSSSDLIFLNSGGGTVCSVPTGSGNLKCTAFFPTGSSVPANGMYLPATNTVGIAAGSTLSQSWTATGSVVAGGLAVGAPTGGNEGAGTINSAAAYYANGTKGVTCSGALTVIASITITNGIITAATGTGGTCS